jgi:nucleotide-binding universal stress UspA family protein
MIAPKNVLVATDFSEPADAALTYGRSFARSYGATLHVLHVVDDIAMRTTELTGGLASVGNVQQQIEDEARARLGAIVTDEDRRDLSVRAVVMTSAAPAQTILAYANAALIDLIVIGTHGRTGLARLFMGSVAQHVVRLAPCPVLTVRRPEREFVLPDALQVAPAVASPAVAG